MKTPQLLLLLIAFSTLAALGAWTVIGQESPVPETASPQETSVQSASQAALSPLASHSSPATGLKVPSPHTAKEQSASQVVILWGPCMVAWN